MLNQPADLFAALGRVEGRRRPLDRIAHAVCFCAPTPMPQGMERQPLSVGPLREQRLWHDRKAAANSGESRPFGETAEFDRALPRARYFENGMRNFGLRNICFVRRVKEQNRCMLVRVLNPFSELLPRCDCSSWIIRKAKINQIGLFLRRLWNKVVLR